MYFETLKFFCDLAAEGSFSKTAEQNSLSQSAVSQQLAQLELEYRCQLIDRKKRPIELTREGKLFYKTAKDIIERYEQFQSELNSLKSTSGFRINVGSIYSIGMHTLPLYVKSFMLKYPQVHIHIEYLEAKRIYKQVLSGEIDFGFVAVPFSNEHFYRPTGIIHRMNKILSKTDNAFLEILQVGELR